MHLMMMRWKDALTSNSANNRLFIKLHKFLCWNCPRLGK